MSVKNAREIASKNALRFDNWHLTKRNRAEMTAKLAENAGRGTASRSEAQRVVCLTAPRTATRGRFTNRKGKAFSLCCATLLSAPMFHSPSPCSLSRHRSDFSQVAGNLRGRGVVLKPGRKNETVKRPRPKNKNFGGRKRHICEGEVRPLCGGGARVPAGC